MGYDLELGFWEALCERLHTDYKSAVLGPFPLYPFTPRLPADYKSAIPALPCNGCFIAIINYQLKVVVCGQAVCDYTRNCV